MAAAKTAQPNGNDNMVPQGWVRPAAHQRYERVLSAIADDWFISDTNGRCNNKDCEISRFHTHRPDGIHRVVALFGPDIFFEQAKPVET